MSGELQFDEASHSYFVDGQRLPSVTTIIKPLDSFDDIPPSVLERKRLVGQDVHLACELLDLGELECADTEIMSYVDGWRRFLRETGAHVLMSEQRLYHPSQRYAGTLDRVVVFPDKSQMLLDLKTCDPMPSHGVQLSAYKLLLDANSLSEPGMRRATLHLHPDGTYLLKQYADPADIACFLALLNVWHWKAAHP